MLVVLENTYSMVWHVGSPVTPIPYYGDVVVVFDPSKTNMAMIVATPTGTHLCHVEFSGNNRKRGPVDDTTMYCYEVRSYLREFLKNCKVYLAAVEEAITKKGSRKGMEFNHQTNMTLTEIRANLLGFFLEEYSIRCLEINNWSWKFDVLPEGFRSPFEKGSKKYFETYLPNSPLTHYFEADMTDCSCILTYVVRHFCNNYTIYCSAPEEKLAEYNYSFTKETLLLPNENQVIFNPNFTVEQNMNFYANRILGTFTMLVEMDFLAIDQIYGHSLSIGFDYLENDKVKAVVARK